MKLDLSSLRRRALWRQQQQAQRSLSSPPLAQPTMNRLRTVACWSDAWRPAAELRKACLASRLDWLRAAPLLAVSEPTATAIGVSPPWLLLASTVVGLPVALWTYKCAMMIIFQRSIIYMGAWPPGARTTAVDPADQQLRGVEVEDVALPGGDPGITLCGVALRRRRESVANDTSMSVKSKQRDPSTVVVYFQGNMGSCVSRLPLFAHLLSSPLSPLSSGQTLILAVCPRSYYLSTNVRPTQAGLTRDYMAVLAHAQRAHPASRIVVYGHSLGGTAACCLLGSIPDQDRSILGDPECTGAEPLELLKPPDALILENPFPSVPLMIERSLYRSRWLPYHFLSPFVLDVWDASAALGQARGSLLGRTPVLFISGEDDSLVLPELVREMYEVAVRSDANAGLPADESSQIAGASDRPTTNGAVGSLRRWLSIPNAHHDNTWTLARPWGQGVRSFLAEVEAVSREEADTPRDVGRGGDA